MLSKLSIENIILIENAELCFSKGLNVLSGETGSGKSAVLQGLSLITGKRAECSVIRRGASRAVIEATFEVRSPAIDEILAKAKLEIAPGAPLQIRREISNLGRSRSSLNEQQVPLSILRELGPHLLEMVAQHATQSLQSVEYHRHVVDIYGDLIDLRKSFSSQWKHCTTLRNELEALIATEERRETELQRYLCEIEEIEEAAITAGEEEELFAEYSRLVNVDSTADKIHEVTESLSQESGVLGLLQRMKPTLDQLNSIDPMLSEIVQMVESTRIEIQEAAYTLANYEGRLERNPLRLEEVNDRLALLRRLKRRFGPELEDVLAYLNESRQQMEELEQADDRIESLREQLTEAEAEADNIAKNLSRRRLEVSKALEEDLTIRLRQLNMAQARFFIRIHPEPRSSHGDDGIEFFVAPNVGEDPVSARDCASGGELSRIMLALTAILSHKERIPTLVFDEVDANIGGETALLVGEKLRALGEEHQILCITHFPQVAQAAHQHLKISKNEADGRTTTRVEALDTSGRQAELSRMLGGESALAGLCQ